jgi:hypothetical protein
MVTGRNRRAITTYERKGCVRTLHLAAPVTRWGKGRWLDVEGRLCTVKAANSTPTVWYVSDQKTMRALELWAQDNNVEGIAFVFRAGPEK